MAIHMAAIWGAVKTGANFAVEIIKSIGVKEVVVAGVSLCAGAFGADLIINNDTTVNLVNVGELATQAGYYRSVQTMEDYSEIFGWDIPLTDNKYIFSYDGIIKAGIDFTQIDISLDKSAKKIIVSMPEIRILSNEIDTDSFRLYHEKDNIFNPLHIDDVNESLGELKEDGMQTAIDAGLINNAKTNAEVLMTGILSASYDMTKYKIEYVWSESVESIDAVE